jgi:Uncharacterized protein conserved in bacteria
MNINISKVKIVVTSPTENSDDIRKALGDAGAGVIRNYSYCTYSSKCIGTFKGNDGTNPYIGESNKLEYVDEEIIVAQCDIKIVKEVLKKLREVHPYEEPSIEIIPLINEEDL